MFRDLNSTYTFSTNRSKGGIMLMNRVGIPKFKSVEILSPLAKIIGFY